MGNRLKAIWSELRRRRVVRSAAAYLAVAFVLLQLAEILFPAFDLGPGALRVLFALLLALFPIIVALSWVYDVTSHGLERTDEATRASGPHAAILGGVVLSALVLAWGGWYAVRNVEPVGPVASAETSIAVLPFADMSEAGDQAYLGDGLAEEVLNILAGIDGLKVAARTSSFAFREDEDVRDIGRQLSVSTILEGSVRRNEGDVREQALREVEARERLIEGVLGERASLEAVAIVVGG